MDEFVSKLRYCIGPVAKFESKKIKIGTERKSIDGTKALKHIELLTDAEFETIRYDTDFIFMSDESDNIRKLMDSKEWAVSEKEV